MARNYAALPHDYLQEMKYLSDEDFGKLCRALLSYSKDGSELELSGEARLFLPRVLLQEDRFQASYEETVEKRREAGRKGGLARSKAKQSQVNASKVKQSQTNDRKINKTETKSETETETESLPPSEERGEKRTRFTPPTLEQVRDYVAQRGSRVDPQGFLDFYASKGWMIGKTPMKDWKAACRNAEAWERWERGETLSQGKPPAELSGVYEDSYQRNLRFLEQLKNQ